jgi:two-component system alkaline phosphatase synthesis response regulator PhoP
MRRALIVEDDPDIVELVAHYLRAEGWAIDSVANGKEALLRLQTDSYQLLILDVQLPGLDGLSVCTEVRKAESTRHLPVVMLTARGDESDRVVGLELGADDYIVKPFSPKELVARVRALLRRTERPSAEDEIIRIGSLSMDRGRRLARWGDEPVHLTAKEFDLLVALLDAHGRVLSRERLLENVWGYTYAEGTRTVDVHIRRLREKLPGVAPKIVTVKGLGYRLARETEES